MSIRVPGCASQSRDVDDAISDVDQGIKRVDHRNTIASVSLLTVDRDSSEVSDGLRSAGVGFDRSDGAFCRARDDASLSDHSFWVAAAPSDVSPTLPAMRVKTAGLRVGDLSRRA